MGRQPWLEEMRQAGLEKVRRQPGLEELRRQLGLEEVTSKFQIHANLGLPVKK